MYKYLKNNKIYLITYEVNNFVANSSPFIIEDEV